MVTIRYKNINSGGHWWLNGKDWQKLEAAGWKVKWFKDDPDITKYYPKGRYLGGLAREASKEFEDKDQAIEEWRALLSMNPFDTGCECCGRPHYFTEV